MGKNKIQISLKIKMFSKSQQFSIKLKVKALKVITNLKKVSDEYLQILN